MLQWILLLALALGIGAVTRTLGAYPRSAILVWAFGTPIVLIAVTLINQAIMRRLLIGAADNRRAIVAGYNNTSMVLARRLQNNPRCQ